MKNVVTIGGGTGSYTVLSGLKNIKNISISALVAMSDDGGSSGILRDELGVMPQGDVRQCLIALSEASPNMLHLMNYRFDKGSLKGHNFGNLFLAALEKLRSDFSSGVEHASRIFKIKGKVIPITLDDARLRVLLKNDRTIEGESQISNTNLKIQDVKKIFYKNKVRLNPKAALAIRRANYIIICPGDFYTSIVPNLIVERFKKSMSLSKAKVIAIENLEDRETEKYIDKLEWYLGKPIDYMIGGDKSLRSKKKIIKEPADAIKRSFIRHDSKKLAKVIERIINNS